MRLFVSVSILGLVTLASLPLARAEDEKPVAPLVGARIADFTLPHAATQTPWALAAETRNARAVVVLFLGTECPVSNAFIPKLNAWAKQYGNDVTFVGINSNEQDDAAVVAKHAKEFGIAFPVLKDAEAQIAAKFQVKRIPEAFVLDGQRLVRYRGRIDDQFAPAVKRDKATTKELVEAIDAVLAGKDVTTAYTAVAGCLLGRTTREPVPVKEGEPITYTKHVARIIQHNCQECHRKGEVGPFKLMTYKDAAAWADNIREVVSDGRMPPWHADPKINHFSNDRRLAEQDKKTLLAWIDQGCVQGDPKDEPPAKQYVTGWGIGQPDEIFRLQKAVKVPASAGRFGVPYQYVLAGEPFTEDKWIQAVEARPDNRGVVHHIIVYVVPPQDPNEKPDPDDTRRRFVAGLLGQQVPKELGRRRRTPDGIGEGMLTAYAPGDQPMIFPPGVAKKIAKGSQLVFQMHYTPNGKAGEDRSMVGVVYAKEPVQHELRVRSVGNPRLEIPAGAAHHEVKAAKSFEKAAMIYSLNPHMHLRGKDFQYDLVYPDGRRETILRVPKYDFSWQTNYNLATPLKVPAGTRVECVAHFDNSENNPFNPNPNVTVRWGDQTWEEMMIGFVDYWYVK
jgi:thiol-disulfide isomerase/thioredoxin